MTDPRAPHGRPGEEPGTTTSGKGTPAPVDMSAAPGALTTYAMVLAGPVLWSVHFLVVYFVTEAGCTGDGPGLRLLDPPVPTVVTLVATAVAAVACLAAAAWAYRHGDTAADAPLAFAGCLLSLLGFVSILFVGVPALFLEAC